MTTPTDVRLLGAIAAGGVLGSLGRYAVGLAMPHTAGSVPWATLVVNLTGCLAVGLLVSFLAGRTGAHALARPFLAVGLLGGWTTYSAFAVDVLDLAHAGRAGVAALYVAASVIGGVVAVLLGSRTGRAIWVER